MRIRYNRAYVKGTLPTSTFEPQARFWHVLRKYCEALYWERRAAMMAAQLGALSKETLFEDLKTMKKVASDLRKEADEIFKHVRPKKPPVSIPIQLFGVEI